MRRNLDYDVFGFQEKKSPILFSEMRSLCPDARFAEKLKNLIFFLVFVLHYSGWCFQECSLRVRKINLEELAGEKSAYKKLVGL